eukprot:COSAG01_NODE_1290_length_10882_cov_25.926922_10_plen_63_part_00
MVVCDGQGTIFSYIPIFVVRPTPEDPGPVLFPLTVRRPFPSWNRSILTEIYLCHACSHVNKC